jgi:hypothetical protein
MAPAIQHELPPGSQPCLREERAWPSVRDPHFDQAALQHGLHRRRDLRLTLPFPAAPSAQEDAVSDRRVFAEVTAQLATEQLALRCGEGARGGLQGAGHHPRRAAS